MTAEALRDVADVYPLSPTQAGMVFHTLAEPESGVYVVQVVYQLRGRAGTDAIAAGVQALVDRHEMLRTVFVWEGMGRPLQVVRADAVADVRTLDWSDDAATGPEALEQLLADDRARGFDMGSEPPFRTTLIEHAADRRTLVWTFHHALLDGWSTELLVGELLELCDAAADRDAAPRDRRPYRDFIAWLSGRDEAVAREFWTARLAGFTSPTSLRQDPRPRLPGPATAPPQHRIDVSELPAGLADRLRSFGRAHGLTVNTIVQGAWSLLTSRYTGQEDVVFGVTASGRPAELAGVEDMVGMFLTTVPRRVRVDGGQGLVPWLRQIQAENLARVDHEHTPLVDIQQWSELPPGVPLFDAIVVFENVPRHAPRASLRVARAEYLDNSNYPLALVVDPEGPVTLRMVSDPAAYEAGAVAGMLGHLTSLLGAMADHPDGAIDQLPMLSAHEMAQLAEWNDTAVEYGDERLIHRIVAAHAAATPDAVAAADGTGSITYAELATRADALADELARRGVQPNSFVGIHLERSVDMVVAIVGILAAGGAYVPLDPTYPAERLAAMLDDAAIEVLVTRSDALDSSPLLAGRTHAPRALWGDLAVASTATGRPPGDAAVSQEPSAGDLAYMIYTSGSTGRPNGVPVEHGRLMHSTLARFAYYDDQPGAFLLLSSLSFDSSVVGIFWTLAAGGTLVLPRPGEELEVRALGRLIASHRVTHTLCLPSLYRLLLDHLEPAQLASLTTVMVAGEACPPDLPDRHASVLPGTALFNEYGPTEATVWCTVHRCEPGPGPVPIGRPIANTSIAILDGRCRPVPVGVPGEIHVGGRGVAQGYHQRPELTAARFVELPAASLPVPEAAGPVRMFRTGDLGRYRPDGAIEFLGRADDQVKVRGHRIELGEVETAILRLGATSAAAPSGGVLVAYVERDPGAPDAGQLQEALRDVLPDHMVPGRLVFVDALPRLPNGKIDRSALRRMAPDPADEPPVTPPRDDLERTLVDVWSEVLPGVEIGVHDDFFRIGGHSILAVSLVEKIRRATGRELRLVALLEAPTVAGQAALLRAEPDPGERSTVVAVKLSGAQPPLYLVPPVAGTPLMFRGLAALLSPDQPVYSFEPLGLDGRTPLPTSIGEMADRYVADLRARQPDGPYRIGGSCMGAHVAWEMAQQLTRDGAEVETVVALDALAPNNGPGWRTEHPDKTPWWLVRAALRHLFRGTLPVTMRRWMQGRRQDREFGPLRRAQLRAQATYEAPAVDVDVFLLQSGELAARPEIYERWSAIAGGRVKRVVIHDSAHRDILSEDPDLVVRMAAEVDRYLAGLGTGVEGHAR